MKFHKSFFAFIIFIFSTTSPIVPTIEEILRRIISTTHNISDLTWKLSTTFAEGTGKGAGEYCGQYGASVFIKLIFGEESITIIEKAQEEIMQGNNLEKLVEMAILKLQISQVTENVEEELKAKRILDLLHKDINVYLQNSIAKIPINNLLSENLSRKHKEKHQIENKLIIDDDDEIHLFLF